MNDSHRPNHKANKTVQLPEAFGRYRIVKQLGQGGMGSVFLARDTQLDRQVAVKVPHFSADDGPEVLERFYREARAAATIEHPNICPVYDVRAIGTTHYLTMAYIEGKPLTDLVSAGKALPQPQVATLVRKVALALEEAHRRGIIHRDLKPANIMINHRGEPVIMDFGLARRSDSKELRLTKSGAVVGTPAYMSPEHLGGGAVGASSDIFSLGTILYELLTGQLPFDGPMTTVLAKILTQEPEPPSQLGADLDKKLEAVCLKALAKDPKQRYGSMADLAADLARFLGSGGPPVASLATETIAKPVGNTQKAAATKPAAPSTTRLPVWEDLVAESPASPKRHLPTSIWKKPLPWLGIGGAVIVVLGILLFSGAIFRVQIKNGIVELTISESGAQVFVDDEQKIALSSSSAKDPIRIEVPEGKHVMKVVKRGFVTETKEFTLRAGTPQEIRVTLRPELSVAGNHAEPPTAEANGKDMPASTNAGWTPLFNGKDLGGWKKQADGQGNWAVEKGILVGRGPKMSHLVTQRDDYTNVHFLIEAKINSSGNAAQCFRVQPWSFDSYEVNIGGRRYSPGHLLSFSGASKSSYDGESISIAPIPANTWFTQEVIAQGNHIIIKVNGEITADLRDNNKTYRSGNLALKVNKVSEAFADPTVVQFRKVLVKEIKPEPAVDFVSLFNGKDLDGWEIDSGNPKGWRVENGALIADASAAGLGWILTERSLMDFVLRFEFQLAPRANSGVTFRAAPNSIPATIKILDDSHPEYAKVPPNMRTGSLWKIAIDEAANLKAIGQWNTMELEVNGRSLRVSVNGAETLRTDALPASNNTTGRLGLQNWGGGDVHFRKIEVKDLNAKVGAGDVPEDGVGEDKVPRSFARRRGAAREKALRDFGGTDESEAAVARGLQWISRNQSPDGKWMLDGKFKDRGAPNDIAGTAFGLLPLLGAGKTHKAGNDNQYDKSIDKALSYLIRKQDKTGDFGRGMYAHGLATIALCEAYGMTQDPNLRRPAQMAINYIVKSQHEGGGWRYDPGNAGDTSVTGWQTTALITARHAGLDVPELSLRKAQRFLDSVCDLANEGYGYTEVGSSPTLSAVGLLLRVHLQSWDAKNPRMIKGVEKNIKTLPPGRFKNIYYEYYATQVMYHFGGEEWKTWNAAMRESLIKSQDTLGGDNLGSWNSEGDPHSSAGGRLMFTSLALLNLEVYYRALGSAND